MVHGYKGLEEHSSHVVRRWRQYVVTEASVLTSQTTQSLNSENNNFESYHSVFSMHYNLVIDAIQTANVFNDYFINVVDSLQTGQADINHALKLLQNSFPEGFADMINVPVTET
jgi:hypothetical protein